MNHQQTQRMQMNQHTRPAQAKEMYSEIKPSVDSRGVVGVPAAPSASLDLALDLALEPRRAHALLREQVPRLLVVSREQLGRRERRARGVEVPMLRVDAFRLAQLVGGVARVPRRGVLAGGHLDLHEVVQRVDPGGYLRGEGNGAT